MKRSVDHDGGSVEKKACTECASAVNPLVRPSQVPEYLRQNEFFKSLNIEDDEEFRVPANCMKANTTVETFQDACDLLETVRFWGANVSLSEVVQIAVMQPLEEIEKKLIPFSNEFLFLEPLMCFLAEDGSDEERMEAAMASGLVEVVQYMEKVVPKFTMQALACAAADGHVNCLQYALKKELTLRSFEDIGCVVQAAVVNGRFECLKLLFESCLLLDADEEGEPPSRSRWGQKIMAVASGYGQLESLQFLHRAGFKMGKSVLKAAANGHLDCLKYIVEIEPFSFYSEWTVSNATREAVMHDRVECLRYLHGVGGSLSGFQGDAILNKSMRCLQYMHEQGEPWDPESCDTAECFDDWDSFFKASKDPRFWEEQDY